MPLSRRDFIQQASAASAAALFASCAPMPLSHRSTLPGRFMMIDVPGLEVDADTAALIREYGVRGVVLFQRNMQSEAQTRGLVESLRVLMGPDALIGVDQEGGGVVRTRTLPFPPAAMSLGSANSPELARRVGAATARGLRSMGFNWDFAPSLDVNNNPLNPVIGDRSFSSDPARVRDIGLAWAQGLMDEGVAPCVKHFPGHGDTAVDSHLGLPTVAKSRPELDAVELLPFAEAARRQIPCFMTSHIVFPTFDADNPATLSRALLTDLLRNAWGYRGVIITDALDMQAITAGYPGGGAAPLALHAGADMVMSLGRAPTIRAHADAIAQAMEKGTLSGAEMREKDARLKALAASYPVATRPYPDAERAADAALMGEAWQAGLAAYHDPRPIPPGQPLTLVVAQSGVGGGASDPGMSGATLVARLTDTHDLRVVLYDPAAPLDAIADFDRFHRPGTPVAFATTARHRPSGDALQLIAHVKPTLHLALWNPYAVLDVPAPAILTFGFRPEALDALQAWLKGDVRATTTLPFSVGTP